MKFVLSFFVSIITCVLLIGQTNSVSGEIKDADTGLPLIGASVLICDQVYITDAQGKFVFEIDENTCFMEVHYLGYSSFEETITIPLEQGQPFIVFLQTSTNVLDQAVISASKNKQRLSESTASLELIKPQFIERINASSIDQTMDQVPGVEVIDGQANIRGGSGYSYGAGSRVLLLMDDMPMLQFDGGIAQWNDIPQDQIRQIEVLKGAASVLYGASALNGVIHMLTKDASAKPRTNASVSYRHYLSPKEIKRKWWTKAPTESSFSLAHSRKIGKLGMNISAFANLLDSYNQSTSERRGRLYSKWRYEYSPKLHFQLTTNTNVGDNSSFFYWSNALRGAYKPGANTVSKVKYLRFNIDPSVTYFTKGGDKHQLNFRAYFAANNNDNDQAVESAFQYLHYQYKRSIWSDLAFLTTGIQGLMNQTSAALYNNLDYRGYNLGSFIQWEHALHKRFKYVLGLRYEWNALYNPAFEYTVGDQNVSVDEKRRQEGEPVVRFGLHFNPLLGTHIRASIGQGYRYPTIAEQFTFTNAGGLKVVPNPDLKSEKGWSAEFGIRQEYAHNDFSTYLDLAVFYAHYSNMMEFTLSDQVFAGFQAQNIGDVNIPGFEATWAGQWELGALMARFMSSYSYILPNYADFTTSIKNSSTSDDNILKYRSKHSVKSSVSIDLFKWTFWANYRYNSHMIAIDRNFEQFISGIKDFRQLYNNGYHILAFQLGYSFKSFSCSLNLDNALNTIYTERPALLEAPRNICVRIAMKI